MKPSEPKPTSKQSTSKADTATRDTNEDKGVAGFTYFLATAVR